ncbi:hypothetical protein L207DRAFT_574541 [Hyaloscypha variabilis F]|uniref:Zn(2)-C6 fungal-type domain-containing protein n=1 Tax=Hyaloscypha variabilis (strain UAMH 11265 / GT02V1 / F) TaxID=1149755 RepID=A0A2J6QRY0_HYAVF|nr:hypothetical protein L207DRAFT_574541 [Hyaloscypha variabilis F]
MSTHQKHKGRKKREGRDRFEAREIERGRTPPPRPDDRDDEDYYFYEAVEEPSQEMQYGMDQLAMGTGDLSMGSTTAPVNLPYGSEQYTSSMGSMAAATIPYNSAFYEGSNAYEQGGVSANSTYRGPEYRGYEPAESADWQQGQPSYSQPSDSTGPPKDGGRRCDRRQRCSECTKKGKDCVYPQEPRRVESRSACVNCKTLKLKCSSDRPCTRCKERNMDCVQGYEEKQKYSKQSKHVVQEQRVGSALEPGYADQSTYDESGSSYSQPYPQTTYGNQGSYSSSWQQPYYPSGRLEAHASHWETLQRQQSGPSASQPPAPSSTQPPIQGPEDIYDVSPPPREDRHSHSSRSHQTPRTSRSHHTPREEQQYSAGNYVRTPSAHFDSPGTLYWRAEEEERRQRQQQEEQQQQQQGQPGFVFQQGTFASVPEGSADMSGQAPQISMPTVPHPNMHSRPQGMPAVSHPNIHSRSQGSSRVHRRPPPRRQPPPPPNTPPPWARYYIRRGAEARMRRDDDPRGSEWVELRADITMDASRPLPSDP